MSTPAQQSRLLVNGASTMHTMISYVVTNELQATMGSVNGVNLDSVLVTAQATYNNYMKPPTLSSVSPSNPTHGGSVSLTISGTNIQRGCTVFVTSPAGGNGTVPYPITDTTSTSPSLTLSIALPISGTYMITIENPSVSASNQLAIVVS